MNLSTNDDGGIRSRGMNSDAELATTARLGSEATFAWGTATK